MFTFFYFLMFLSLVGGLALGFKVVSLIRRMREPRQVSAPLIQINDVPKTYNIN